MSESPGHDWTPPDQDDDNSLVEFTPEEESDDDLGDDQDDSSPDSYTPDDLGTYTVSTGPRRSDLTARIGVHALRKLFVQPGDTLTIYEHPRGLLVVPSYESREEESLEETDIDADDATGEFDLDSAWDDEESDSDGSMSEIWTAEESGPIPPDVLYSEIVEYDCRWCHSGCINHVEESCTQAKECRKCHWAPVIEDLDPINYHLPEKYRPDPETEAVEE